MIPINKPQIDREEVEAVAAVLRTGRLTDPSPEGGPTVRRFEASLGRFLGVKNVIAVSSGTAALHSTLLALGIGEGDEVLLPSFTFIATANAVVQSGAKPVFVDIDKSDYTLDLEDLHEKLTARSKAVIPVHLYGYPCGMDEMIELCRRKGLRVIEDAAQSLGATYKGRQTASLGDAGCLSFYGSKVITCGEGGAVATNDAELAEKLRRVRTHGGYDQDYNVRVAGTNMRMPEMQAALGLAQMKKLPRFLKARKKNASRLQGLLENLNGIALPPNNSSRVPNWYVFTVAVTSNRDAILDHLNRGGIGAAAYYKTPIHRTELYAKLGYGDVALPNTEWAANHVISLPVHQSLTQRDIDRIALVLKRALSDRLPP